MADEKKDKEPKKIDDTDEPESPGTLGSTEGPGAPAPEPEPPLPPPPGSTEGPGGQG
jgi:hypothetical protein